MFASKNDLAKHERTHTGERPYACDKCTFRTATSGTLKVHMIRKHEDPEAHKQFFCTICGKSCFAAHELKKHIRTHSDFKQYSCPECGKQLKNDSCYRRHMMAVHDKKHTCELCQKNFSALAGLAIHKRDVHGIMK